MVVVGVVLLVVVGIKGFLDVVWVVVGIKGFLDVVRVVVGIKGFLDVVCVVDVVGCNGFLVTVAL